MKIRNSLACWLVLDANQKRQIKKHLAAAFAKAGFWMPDALILAGACAVSRGAALIYPPAGWIVGGVFLVCCGVMLARSK